MKIIRSTNILLLVLLLLSGLKGFGQNNKLCVGHHWTPKGANLKMKEFASTWNDLESWEDRASMIKRGIIEGMKLNEMPKIEGNFMRKLRIPAYLTDILLRTY